jgi:hypothetical protein
MVKNIEVTLPNIKGWAQLCDRVRGAPLFCDADIVDLHLSLTGGTRLQLETWSLGADGTYNKEDPILVTFNFDEVSEVMLSNLLPSAFVDELVISETDNGVRLTWESGYGVDGFIESAVIIVVFTDGERPR